MTLLKRIARINLLPGKINLNIHMELTIPEVDIDGTTYKVIMKQREASNNFEVTFAAPVTTNQKLSQ